MNLLHTRRQHRAFRIGRKRVTVLDLADDAVKSDLFTFTEHDNDLRLYQYFLDRCTELLDASGAKKTWSFGFDAPFAIFATVAM